MKATCETCKFHHTLPWKTETDEGINHFCRFNPPVSVGPTQSVLLPTAPDGWCGQFQPVAKRRAKS